MLESLGLQSAALSGMGEVVGGILADPDWSAREAAVDDGDDAGGGDEFTGRWGFGEVC